MGRGKGSGLRYPPRSHPKQGVDVRRVPLHLSEAVRVAWKLGTEDLKEVLRLLLEPTLTHSLLPHAGTEKSETLTLVGLVPRPHPEVPT